MNKFNFKEWLKLRETGTGTNAIAVFARPVFSAPIRRAIRDGKLKSPFSGGDRAAK